MLNKKGFTLVELLAVIVILAIIAVIAVPSILRIIENSRKDSFKASALSAMKSFEQGIVIGEYEKDVIYELKNLKNLDNNPFEGGEIVYDSSLKKVIIYNGSDNDDLTKVKYIINGDKEEINSNDEVVVSLRDNNPDLLVNRIKAAITTECIVNSYGAEQCIVGDNEPINKGYLRGPQLGVDNYVEFGEWVFEGETEPLLWRVVRINEDGSLLMVTDNIIHNQPYYTSDTCWINSDTKEYDFSGCKNNFAFSDVKTYLNTTFYNEITNKKIFQYNKWDIKSEEEELDANPTTPTSLIAKVGLLTQNDYREGTKSSEEFSVADDIYNAYLNNPAFTSSSSWYLSTPSYNGRITGADGSYGVYDERIYYANEEFGEVYNIGYAIGGVRPAAVLRPGVAVACISCDGSSAAPYKIE